MVVALYGRTVLKVETFDYLRGINRIKADVSDEEALAIISYNEDKARSESDTQERIAAALEFIELLMMGDKA